jgi:hypothetical protein
VSGLDSSIAHRPSPACWSWPNRASPSFGFRLQPDLLGSMPLLETWGDENGIGRMVRDYHKSGDWLRPRSRLGCARSPKFHVIL